VSSGMKRVVLGVLAAVIVAVVIVGLVFLVRQLKFSPPSSAVIQPSPPSSAVKPATEGRCYLHRWHAMVRQEEKRCLFAPRRCQAMGNAIALAPGG
jgi:hypothetical protein